MHRVRISRQLVALSACVLLGGCQSWFARDTGKFQVRAVGPDQTLQADAAAALARGRSQLDRGEPAAAIQSFRIAGNDPETQAAAWNGLGVAYARLGRPDLGENYFRSAVLADPANEAFAGNLERLLATNPAARRPEPAVELAAVTPMAPVVEPSVAKRPNVLLLRTGVQLTTARTETPATSLSRVSRQEVRLTTSPRAVPADPRRRNPRYAGPQPSAPTPAPTPAADARYPVRLASGRSEQQPVQGGVTLETVVNTPSPNAVRIRFGAGTR